MYKRIVFPLGLLLIASQAVASVNEVESNDAVAVYTGVGEDRVFDHWDLSSAVPLPATDEAVGQMNGPIDSDLFYFDVATNATGERNIPVFFGCNKKYGDYHTSGVDTTDESTWSVKYFYQAQDSTVPVLQSDYVVGKEDCRQGLADITGPFRFQINAKKQGRYFIWIEGRYLGEKTITLFDEVTQKETKKVISAWIANTADYTLRAITSKGDDEMEPNNGILEAYPLPADDSVTAQLSSMYDEDWFYIRTADENKSRVTSIYMSCAAGSSGSNGDNDPLFLVSTYDPLGNMQSSYQVGASRCTVEGGFKFSIKTPAQGDYYVVVSAPTYNENARYSDLDFKLSQFFQINDGGGSGGSGSFTGTIRKAAITDSTAPGKDRFSVVLNNCNSGGVGNLTLSGSKLDLSNLADTMQVKVQVGGWSCLTDTTTFVKDGTSTTKTIYKYPAP